ncbi:hypothetical protein ACGFKX_02500, partial [Pseudonocardia alni]|uniref:hypothetical protein n=1 Tax=Pseudonocardia alni TaxID=33907 RepID=UPI0037101D77
MPDALRHDTSHVSPTDRDRGLREWATILPVPGARCPVPGARCPVPGARCPVPGARCPVPGAR